MLIEVMDVSHFTIPAARLAHAQDLVARFARKAVKLGMPSPSLVAGEAFDRTWILGRNGSPVAGPFDGFVPINPRRPISVTRFVNVEVLGARPIIAGWEFAATIEHTSEGNFVWSVPGSSTLPVEYRDASAQVCDHCRTSRDRNKTFVVREISTGEYKRVGSSCLQDFLGDASPAAWFAAMQTIRELEELGSEYEDGLGGFGGSVRAVGVELFLGGVIAFAREYGYVSAAQARQSYSEGVMSTGDEVLGALTSTKNAVWQSAQDMITDDDTAGGRAALAWLNEQDASASDYLYNLQLTVKLGTVDHRTARLLASVIPSFNRELIKTRTSHRVDAWFDAAVGERPVIDAMVEREGSYETDFGTTFVITLLGIDGHTFVWKTSNPRSVDGERVRIGDSFRLTGTVKELSEYKGTKQTTLSRCNLFAPESVDKPLITAARKFAKAHGSEVPQWAWTKAQIKRAAKTAA